MRRWIALLGVVGAAVAYLGVSAIPAVGADSGTVGAKVVAAAPCLTVSPSSIDFGIGAFSGGGGPMVTLTASPKHSVQSCSVAEQTLVVGGTNAFDSAGTPLWTLVQGNPCTGGPNRYAVSVQLQGNPPVELFLSGNFTVGQLLAGGSFSLDAFLTMPCGGSAGAGQAMTMSIIYTAIF